MPLIMDTDCRSNVGSMPFIPGLTEVTLHFKHGFQLVIAHVVDHIALGLQSFRVEHYAIEIIRE